MFGKVLKDILTGVDGDSFDVIRCTGAITILVTLMLTAYVVVVKNTAFDLQNFGLCMAAIFTSIGAGIKLKETTEPQIKQQIVIKKAIENVDPPDA